MEYSIFQSCKRVGHFVLLCGYFNVRYENSAVCLLHSLGNVEVQQQVYRSIIEKKFSIVSPESEELNKILMLTLARAVNAVCEWLFIIHFISITIIDIQ